MPSFIPLPKNQKVTYCAQVWQGFGHPRRHPVSQTCLERCRGYPTASNCDLKGHFLAFFGTRWALEVRMCSCVCYIPTTIYYIISEAYCPRQSSFLLKISWFSMEKVLIHCFLYICNMYLSYWEKQKLLFFQFFWASQVRHSQAFWSLTISFLALR